MGSQRPSPTHGGVDSIDGASAGGRSRGGGGGSGGGRGSSNSIDGDHNHRGHGGRGSGGVSNATTSFILNAMDDFNNNADAQVRSWVFALIARCDICSVFSHCSVFASYALAVSEVQCMREVQPTNADVLCAGW